jgi:putative DNA primase/helicase
MAGGTRGLGAAAEADADAALLQAQLAEAQRQLAALNAEQDKQAAADKEAEEALAATTRARSLRKQVKAAQKAVAALRKRVDQAARYNKYLKELADADHEGFDERLDQICGQLIERITGRDEPLAKAADMTAEQEAMIKQGMARLDGQRIHYNGMMDDHPLSAFEPSIKGLAEAAAFYADGCLKWVADVRAWRVYNYYEGRYDKVYGETALEYLLFWLIKRLYQQADPRDNDHETWLYQHLPIDKIVRILKTDARMVVRDDMFDRAPHLLNCKGLCVDLRTGKIRPSEPKDYFTHTTSVGPIAGEAPRFLDFLGQLCDGDATMVDFISCFFAVALTAYPFPLYIQLIGPGGNGKGTLLHFFFKLFGDYAGVINSALLLDRGGFGSIDTYIVSLKGVRLGIQGDLPNGRLREDVVKNMTGNDPFNLADKYEKATTFYLGLKIAFASQHKPRLSSVGEDMRRRMRLVPCYHRTPEDQRIFDLEDKLMEEAPQVLQLLIDTCVDVLSRSPDHIILPRCAKVEAMSAEYLEEEDVIGHFLAERTEADPQAAESSERLFKVFRAYLEIEGLNRVAWSNKTFTRELLDRGYTKIKKRTGVMIMGLKIKADPDELKEGAK